MMLEGSVFKKLKGEKHSSDNDDHYLPNIDSRVTLFTYFSFKIYYKTSLETFTVLN